MYNPYFYQQNYQQNYQQRQNHLPQQQIIQVNGKASVETRISRLEQIIAEMRSQNESNDDEFKQSNKDNVRKG